MATFNKGDKVRLRDNAGDTMERTAKTSSGTPSWTKRKRSALGHIGIVIAANVRENSYRVEFDNGDMFYVTSEALEARSERGRGEPSEPSRPSTSDLKVGDRVVFRKGIKKLLEGEDCGFVSDMADYINLVGKVTHFNARTKEVHVKFIADKEPYCYPQKALMLASEESQPEPKKLKVGDKVVLLSDAERKFRGSEYSWEPNMKAIIDERQVGEIMRINEDGKAAKVEFENNSNWYYPVSALGLDSRKKGTPKKSDAPSSKLKVGDKVRIRTDAKKITADLVRYEETGCDWGSGRDKLVGKVGTIIEGPDKVDDIRIEFIHNDFEWFPAKAVELVNEESQPEPSDERKKVDGKDLKEYDFFVVDDTGRIPQGKIHKGGIYQAVKDSDRSALYAEVYDRPDKDDEKGHITFSDNKLQLRYATDEEKNEYIKKNYNTDLRIGDKVEVVKSGESYPGDVEDLTKALGLNKKDDQSAKDGAKGVVFHIVRNHSKTKNLLVVVRLTDGTDIVIGPKGLKVISKGGKAPSTPKSDKWNSGLNKWDFVVLEDLGSGSGATGSWEIGDTFRLDENTSSGSFSVEIDGNGQQNFFSAAKKLGIKIRKVDDADVINEYIYEKYKTDFQIDDEIEVVNNSCIYGVHDKMMSELKSEMSGLMEHHHIKYKPKDGERGYILSIVKDDSNTQRLWAIVKSKGKDETFLICLRLKDGENETKYFKKVGSSSRKRPSEPSSELKVGDKVRLKKDAKKIIERLKSENKTGCDWSRGKQQLIDNETVATITKTDHDDDAKIEYSDDYDWLPLSALELVSSGKSEPRDDGKFKKGDKIKLRSDAERIIKKEAERSDGSGAEWVTSMKKIINERVVGIATVDTDESDNTIKIRFKASDGEHHLWFPIKAIMHADDSDEEQPSDDDEETPSEHYDFKRNDYVVLTDFGDTCASTEGQFSLNSVYQLSKDMERIRFSVHLDDSNEDNGYQLDDCPGMKFRQATKEEVLEYRNKKDFHAFPGDTIRVKDELKASIRRYNWSRGMSEFVGKEYEVERVIFESPDTAKEYPAEWNTYLKLSGQWHITNTDFVIVKQHIPGSDNKPTKKTKGKSEKKAPKKVEKPIVEGDSVRVREDAEMIMEDTQAWFSDMNERVGKKGVVDIVDVSPDGYVRVFVKFIDDKVFWFTIDALERLEAPAEAVPAKVSALRGEGVGFLVKYTNGSGMYIMMNQKDENGLPKSYSEQDIDAVMIETGNGLELIGHDTQYIAEKRSISDEDAKGDIVERYELYSIIDAVSDAQKASDRELAEKTIAEYEVALSIATTKAQKQDLKDKIEAVKLLMD